MTRMLQYYRCPDWFAAIETNTPPGASPTALAAVARLGLGDVGCAGAGESPAFNLSEVIDTLRYERYRLEPQDALERVTASRTSRAMYYFLRPILGLPVRKHLQRIRLQGWETMAFPRWPVDVTVDVIMQEALAAAITHRGMKEIPFIWFWPDGRSSCATVTHDVESGAGWDYCDRLMDLDDSAGIKASFQIVPRGRYDVSEWRLDAFRVRGFEINVHDLNHDGHLFREQDEFRRLAVEINDYARRFGSRGFRAGAMYRNQRWYDAFEFSYDMSVPNVAHLDPQRGGCCTVMPYFVGNVLELPLTTIQDYSLFHILNDYSTALWMQQIEIISAHHGLITVLTHPDYLRPERAQRVYRELLATLTHRRECQQLWVALPSEIDAWWRQRQQMRLVADGDAWRVEGAGAQRASVAYACVEDGRLVYRLDRVPMQKSA